MVREKRKANSIEQVVTTTILYKCDLYAPDSPLGKEMNFAIKVSPYGRYLIRHECGSFRVALKVELIEMRYVLSYMMSYERGKAKKLCYTNAVQHALKYPAEWKPDAAGFITAHLGRHIDDGYLNLAYVLHAVQLWLNNHPAPGQLPGQPQPMDGLPPPHAQQDYPSPMQPQPLVGRAAQAALHQQQQPPMGYGPMGGMGGPMPSRQMRWSLGGMGGAPSAGYPAAAPPMGRVPVRPTILTREHRCACAHCINRVTPCLLEEVTGLWWVMKVRLKKESAPRACPLRRFEPQHNGDGD